MLLAYCNTICMFLKIFLFESQWVPWKSDWVSLTEMRILNCILSIKFFTFNLTQMKWNIHTHAHKFLALSFHLQVIHFKTAMPLFSAKRNSMKCFFLLSFLHHFRIYFFLYIVCCCQCWWWSIVRLSLLLFSQTIQNGKRKRMPYFAISQCPTTMYRSYSNDCCNIHICVASSAAAASLYKSESYVKAASIFQAQSSRSFHAPPSSLSLSLLLLEQHCQVK